MNPDNDALSRTYFIAGPPRVGKSLLAYRVAERIAGHVVSTDAIRSAAKKARPDKAGDLFKINAYNELSVEEWLTLHTQNPEKVVVDQNRESRAFWSSTVSFCNTFAEDYVQHIVEGVALLPELVAAMDHKPQHVVYIGNTSDDHYQVMQEYAHAHPEQDWMAAMGYNETRVRALATFVKKMSEYFKAEAAKYHFPYVEMDDNDFFGSLARAEAVLFKE
jgi:2-phosphoglycerate kinase